MHAKSWILDDRVLFTGSTNLTHGGFENNKEHMLKVLETQVVRDALKDLEESWELSEFVTEEHIANMMETKREKSEKPSRSVSRSLSCELDEVRATRSSERI